MNKNEIDQKIKDILGSINDEDNLDLSQEITDTAEIRDFSSLIDASSEDADNLIGTTLSHWHIKELIGKGGMSSIYLAERNDEQLNQHVALKVLPQNLANDTLVNRFIRERQILSDLNHQNIAKLYDVGVTERGVPWFVMEYIQGEDILQYAKSQGLNTEQKIMLFKQVCDALAYSHAQGVVHRDIKPGNLLVTKDGVVKLLDFGIASDNEHQSLTMTGAIMGTPGYMSPEQAKGLNEKIDRRSDVFSAGVLLYKLIKDDMPFQADSISEISYKIIHDEPTLLGSNIPPDIQAIVFKCLEKEATLRYSSFKQLNNDLTAYLNGDVISAQKITLIGRSLKKVKKHKMLAAVLLITFTVAILGIVYGVYQSFTSSQKVEHTKKYLTITENLKNKIRRSHMMPFHNIQEEYKSFEIEIQNLKTEIQNENFNDVGLSDFAIGTAYFDMRNDKKAWEHFKLSEQKGFQDSELFSGLGKLSAKQWQQKNKHANSIQNEKDREDFIHAAKEELFYPAIKYLSKAQLGQSEAYYLKAYVAFVESKYLDSINLIEKEVQLNPWHYEALLLAAESYSLLAIQSGKLNGQDSVTDLIEKSNALLEQAIQIGESDPQNYVQRCAYSGRDIQNQKYFNYKGIENLSTHGIEHCQNAITLNPNDTKPWIGLHQIHKTLGEHQEFLDKASLNKYNDTISDKALKHYRKALEVLKQALKISPNDFEVLLLQIKPLYIIAFRTYLNGGDPNIYYNQALEAINQAHNIDLKSPEPWLQQAYIYSEMSYYYMTQVKDLHQAELYANKSIESATKANQIDSNYSRVIRINAYRYSLANVKYEQGQVLEATKILRQSINERFDIIPRRSAFFKNFNDIIRAQKVLIDLMIEINQPIETDAKVGAQMINLVCTFEGLIDEQKAQLSILTKEYLDNNWLNEVSFKSCL